MGCAGYAHNMAPSSIRKMTIDGAVLVFVVNMHLSALKQAYRHACFLPAGLSVLSHGFAHFPRENVSGYATKQPFSHPSQSNYVLVA